MSASSLSTHEQPGFGSSAIQRLARALLWVGLGNLGIWLFACLKSFYLGTGAIMLPVQASLAFTQAHHPLSRYIATSAGAYFTGSKGELLYHASSLGDYFLFYTLGELTSLDALYFAGLGIYLHRPLRRLPAEGEFTPALSRAITFVGLATTCMFMLKMLLAAAANEVFWTKTNHLFRLASPTSTGGLLYVVFGLVLTLCAAFFQRGQQLQQDNELTI